MDNLLAFFGLITKASTESLVVFVVLVSMGFSYLVIKMVIDALSNVRGNK